MEWELVGGCLTYQEHAWGSHQGPAELGGEGGLVGITPPSSGPPPAAWVANLLSMT